MKWAGKASRLQSPGQIAWAMGKPAREEGYQHLPPGCGGIPQRHGRCWHCRPELHCFDALTQVWSMTIQDQLSRWATTPYSWQKYRSYYITKASTMESSLQIINKHCILFINLVKILQGLAQLPDESPVCSLWRMLQAEELSEQPTPLQVQLPQP